MANLTGDREAGDLRFELRRGEVSRAEDPPSTTAPRYPGIRRPKGGGSAGLTISSLGAFTYDDRRPRVSSKSIVIAQVAAIWLSRGLA
jgi:hypothetical protein